MRAKVPTSFDHRPCPTAVAIACHATPPHRSLVAPAGALLLAAGPLSTKAQQDSIYSALKPDGDLSTLKAVVDAAGLAEALSDSTLAYTVFAPTNAVSKYRWPP